MDEDLIEKLDNEMNDADAFYYEKTHLYLTKNYIINFQGRFKVIEYRDVIWMYAMNYRTNGIKTSQSINIMDVKGKVTSIATINIVTKGKKEIYDEIWNTIASKNTNILLGYTKENAETAKTMKENQNERKPESDRQDNHCGSYCDCGRLTAHALEQLDGSIGAGFNTIASQIY